MNIEKINPLSEIKQFLEESDVRLICYDDVQVLFEYNEIYYKTMLQPDNEDEIIVEKEENVVKKGNLEYVMTFIHEEILEKNM